MTASTASQGTKSLDAEALIRPTIRSMPLYQPATIPHSHPTDIVKLDMNESPYPPSPRTQEILRTFTGANRYPDFEQSALRAALGEYLGVPTGQIVCGAGLDDVLNTVAMTLLDEGDEVIISEPTFGVYRSLMSLHGARVVDADLTATFELDPELVVSKISDRTKLIIVCTPNNPTGNLLDRGAVEYVVRHTPCLVAIDEAYAEFSGVSHRSKMDEHDNVAILRTMSKFAGLAGMRVGYGAFPDALMPYLMTAAPPFMNISVVSREAALASLADVEHLQKNVDKILSERETLGSHLAGMAGVEPLPSATNFLLVRIPSRAGTEIKRELAQDGIFIRDFPNPRLGLTDCIRVTVGTSDNNRRFLEGFQRVLTRAEDAA